MDLFNIYKEIQQDDKVNKTFKGIHVIESTELSGQKTVEERIDEIYEAMKFPGELVFKMDMTQESPKSKVNDFKNNIENQLGMFEEVIDVEEIKEEHYAKILFCTVPFMIHFKEEGLGLRSKSIINKVFPDFEERNWSNFLLRELLNEYIRDHFESKRKPEKLSFKTTGLMDKVKDHYYLYWKQSDVRAYFILRWILSLEIDLSDHVNLLVPPTLVLLYDDTLQGRKISIEVANLLFKRIPVSMLKSRGLDEIYVKAISDCILFSNEGDMELSEGALICLIDLFQQFYKPTSDIYYENLYKYIINPTIMRGYSSSGEFIPSRKFLLSHLPKLCDLMGLYVYAMLKEFIDMCNENLKLAYTQKGILNIELPTLACECLKHLINIAELRIDVYASSILVSVVSCYLNCYKYTSSDKLIDKLVELVISLSKVGDLNQIKVDLKAIKNNDIEIFGAFVDRMLQAIP